MITYSNRVTVEFKPLKSSRLDYRSRVHRVCFAVLKQLGYDNNDTLIALNMGAVLLTSFGEDFPSLWRTSILEGKRLGPRAFESTIHNSAISYTSNLLGLPGPVLTIVDGDPEYVAAIQIWAGRAKAMLVCQADLNTSATCFLLEKS